ncbi:MAG TPA: DUF2993 domain-containing protein [Natronosporangium sp.]|nr:DUF2993 domain-containing protein [Natronosporangium sp.]
MRTLRRVLVALLVLLVLLAVADRVGAWVAQRALADQVSQELAARGVDSAPPEVSIAGVPFLTQVAAGRYELITVHLRDVGTDQLRLATVELTARDVTAAARDLLNREGPVVADRLTGDITVGYARVVELTGLPQLTLTAAEDGRLRIALTTEALGAPVQVSGVASATVVDNTVRLAVEELRLVEPSIPIGAEALLAELAQRLSVTVVLPPLPYGLQLESVRAEPAGLVVRVTADQVRLV